MHISGFSGRVMVILSMIASLRRVNIRAKCAGISILLIFLTSQALVAQTCSITSSTNWDNPGPACQEGGTPASKSVLSIPAGVTVTFNNNGDTWAGSRIDVYGTLAITAPGSVTINASIHVKNGGLVSIDSKLNLGSGGGCGYVLVAEVGGKIDIISGTPDRLNICGNEIARGGTSGCNNNYPNGSPSYCEPAGGFTGPTGFTESGYSSALPVTLEYFKGTPGKSGVYLEWATSYEENFEKFVIQRTVDGISFEDLGIVQSNSGPSQSLQKYSYYDHYPYYGLNYYRLAAVDFDRSVDYYGPVVVRYNDQKRVIVTQHDGVISARLNFPPEEQFEFIVMDMFGRTIGRRKITGSITPLDMNLVTGTYLLIAVNGSEKITTRFVVQR